MLFSDSPERVRLLRTLVEAEDKWSKTKIKQNQQNKRLQQKDVK